MLLGCLKTALLENLKKKILSSLHGSEWMLNSNNNAMLCPKYKWLSSKGFLLSCLWILKCHQNYCIRRKIPLTLQQNPNFPIWPLYEILWNEVIQFKNHIVETSVKRACLYPESGHSFHGCTLPKLAQCRVLYSLETVKWHFTEGLWITESNHVHKALHL